MKILFISLRITLLLTFIIVHEFLHEKKRTKDIETFLYRLRTFGALSCLTGPTYRDRKLSCLLRFREPHQWFTFCRDGLGGAGRGTHLQ
jgi:hypothetical protein